MKTLFFPLFFLLFLLNFSGCAAIEETIHPETHELTLDDARGMYNLRNVRHLHQILSGPQSREINEMYGAEVVQAGDRITYYKSERSKPTRIRGYTFLAKTEGELGRIEILVATSQGRIDRVKVKENPSIKGRPAVSGEFLAQFSGRTLKNSWKVAQDPSDSFTLPSKIRPIDGHPEISQDISDAIRKVLVFAVVLNLK